MTANVAETYGDLNYVVNDNNTIMITGCDKSATEVIITNEIDGIPVTSIGYWVFGGCSSLESVTIPESITDINLYAFHGCENFNRITILNPKCNIVKRKDTFNGTATIYGYENSTAQEYAEKFDYKFVSLGEVPEIFPTGDINGDGEFNIPDVVLFQKYILGVSDTEISDLKNADLNSDGVSDVFDLCLMKKKFLENK